MIQISEILELSLFKDFKIICGEKYLNNLVNATVILEYESSRIDYEGYGYGYLYCYPISLLILIRNWSMGHSVP